MVSFQENQGKLAPER